jgi:preprotein translocase SecE subunit
VRVRVLLPLPFDSRGLICRPEEGIKVSDTTTSVEGKHKESWGEFITKTRGELDKTTFPSSNDVKGTTIIVIIAVIFFAVYLFVVDQAWVFLLDGLTWLINKIAGI